jgi:soluble lytic murein transglycosylase-like protein
MVSVMRSLIPAVFTVVMTLAVTAAADDHPSFDPELRDALSRAIDESTSFSDRYEAEVWLMDMSNRLSNRIPDEEKRLRLLRQIHAEATRVDLRPELVLSVIEVESDFDRYAISRVGARGLMQIMPFWLEEIGRPEANLFKPSVNLRFGCTILRHYLDMEDGNLTQALARYNGSLGSMRYPSLVYSALAESWRTE